MSVNLLSGQATETAPVNGVCFCRVCKSLVCCYLACLAIPLILLTSVLVAILSAFLGWIDAEAAHRRVGIGVLSISDI